MHTPKLSVIVIIGPGEHAWVELINDLIFLPHGTEIIFSTLRQYKGFQHAPTLAKLNHKTTKWVFGHTGKSSLLNTGAGEAKGDFLWFLHADTRFTKHTISNLMRAITRHPNALHYCDLEYRNDGKEFVIHNRIQWICSHLLHVVIGQQGLCLSHDNYKRLKGFSETLSKQEDIMFCINALSNGIVLRCIEAPISTRARHYLNHGHFRSSVQNILTTLYFAPTCCWFTLKATFGFYKK
jgi:hypothetical protein